MKATKLERYRNRNVYRFPVERALLNASIDRLQQTELETIHVVAHTAADAANWALQHTLDAVSEPCEVTAYGSRGGKVYRYAGWHSTIAHGLWNRVRR